MSLLPGARVILYDGSPFQPDLTTFIRLIGEQKVTKLGISPRWMTEIQKNGIKPREFTDLSNLKMVTSTGMVLSDQLFEWFYDVGFPKETHLANISGGTDIVGSMIPIYVTSVLIYHTGWLFWHGKSFDTSIRWRMSRHGSGNSSRSIRLPH